MATTTNTNTNENTNTEENTMNTNTSTPVAASTTSAPAAPAGITWEAPPAEVAAPKRQKGAKRAAIVESLKQNPGQWAKVKQNLKYVTEATEWRKLGCEVRTGKPEGQDLYSIWARWPEVESTDVKAEVEPEPVKAPAKPAAKPATAKPSTRK